MKGYATIVVLVLLALFGLAWCDLHHAVEAPAGFAVRDEAGGRETR